MDHHFSCAAARSPCPCSQLCPLPRQVLAFHARHLPVFYSTRPRLAGIECSLSRSVFPLQVRSRKTHRKGKGPAPAPTLLLTRQMSSPCLQDKGEGFPGAG